MYSCGCCPTAHKGLKSPKRFTNLEVIFIKQNLRFGKLRDGREFGFTIEVDIREHSYMTSDFWVRW